MWCAGIHRHFVLYGLMEYLGRRFVQSCFHTSIAEFLSILIYLNLEPSLSTITVYSFDRQFTADEVLQLLDRFYNIEMLVSSNYNKHWSLHGLLYSWVNGLYMLLLSFSEIRR